MKIRYSHNQLSICFLLLFASVSIIEVSAQNSSKVYRLKGVDHANETLSYHERFQFDEFRKGVVYLTTGGMSEALLNYNFLFNEIQFLGPDKDTLSIFDNNRVRFVAVGEDLFYHSDVHGYMQVVGEYQTIKLGKKQGLVSIGTEKTVGYNTYVATSATDSYSSYVSATGQLNKLEKKNVLVVKMNRSSFFLIDGNGKFYPAAKSGLLKIYGKNRKPVLDYLNSNEINFENEQDLKKVLTFCSRLNQQL